jgi:hypothetical protein
MDLRWAEVLNPRNKSLVERLPYTGSWLEILATELKRRAGAIPASSTDNHNAPRQIRRSR